MGADCCGHHHHHGDRHHDAGRPADGRASPPPRGAKMSFRISGLDCVEEVSILKAELGPLVGGADKLAFDVLNARMSVLAQGVDPGRIIAAVAGTGMRATPWDKGRPGGEDARRRRLALLTATSGAMTAAGAAFDVVADARLPAQFCDAAAIFVGLWVVLPKALFALRRLRPDMNLLMTIAVAGALALGDWAEAATVSFLFALSLALESWSAGRARRAVAALLDLAPLAARVKRPGDGEATMSPEEVPVGSVVVVHPGERIPLDGRVVAGESAVDQASITGESLPAAKAPGAAVFAGTVNGDGMLEIETLKPAEDSTLAHVSRLIEEAQSRRSGAERWVDRFAAVYTPLVMILALGVLLAPPLLLGGAWEIWIYRALVLLVIACPCALVISTPVTVVSALAAAARQGVLVKGGEHLERPATLKAVAFDKTGTVTTGRLDVETVVPLGGHSEAELLARAAALEARSTHPIARAVIAYAEARGVRAAPAEDVRAFPGKGMVGTVARRNYWLGSHRYMEERDAETPEIHQLAERLAEGGRSVVAIGSEDHVCGLVALSDGVREEAPEALLALKRSGVERLVMLTGDNRETAERIAGQLGIDETAAELLPEDKVAEVARLVARFGSVAVVGDGVNDAPAMARASLGIAMGASGTDTAIETADVALMSDDLGKLAWLVGHSRRMLAIIRQNVVFALSVKALFAVMAFAGMATLWGAIAADTGASLLVVFNGLRMLTPGRAVVSGRTRS